MNTSHNRSKVRFVASLGLGLVISVGLSYAMIVYALALGFDGPGQLSTLDAARWISVALGTTVGGLGLAFVALHRLLRSMAGAILGLLPGAVLCLYFLNMVVWEAVKLAQR